MTSQTPSGNQPTSSANSLQTFYKNNPWKSRFILVLLSLIILLGIARLALPQSIIYGTTSWLKGNGIDATIEDIDINIFSGTVSLVNAKGYRDNEPIFNIGLIDIHWYWAPLSKKTVVITRVALDNLKIDIEQYSDEIIVGGLHIPLNGPADPDAEDDGNKEVEPETVKPETVKPETIKPWAASLGEVIFTNLNVCYLQDTSTRADAGEASRFIDYCIKLDEMTWGGTIGYGVDPALLKSDDLALSSTGDFKLNGLTVTDNKLNKDLLRSSSNTLTRVSVAGLNNIHIDKLEMKGLSALQRDDTGHKDAVRFKQLIVNDIKLSNLNALTIDSVSLDDTGLYIVKLSPTNWEYAQWIPQSPDAEPGNKSSEPETAKASTFDFAINNIQINRSDFCYLEAEINIYYCFNQDELDWKGSIKTSSSAGDTKISIEGELTANNTKIHNPKLKRDLLDIRSISLTALNIADVNKISFEDLTIKNLSALQRGDKPDDSTASFSSLTINKVAYTGDAVSINKISLSDLSSLVSKNKDGSWEYDKWLTSADSKTSSGNKKTTDKPSTDKQSPAKSKPLLISIKTAEIKTDKELLFIDNSTKPVMTIGLNKLDFNIHDLDANKPDTDSPFKLQARTTRHSTIDIKGTARPFADKVSFDAKGKLKGFDLRAASPAAEKAIGHSIKSGQMDADLALLAKEGILDSNIALSLYHFNIKAESKKDAEKLDKKFGMPLNQTLVLLRDKDGSIHIDIPITGDINNPDFNPMDAIITATSKAATVTLITFYTPYGLAYFGGSALFDLATALDFKPIIFQPGSAEMPENSKEQLKKMAKLLTEKPQVHLTLCGVTNRQDSYALYPDLKDKSDKDKKVVKLNPDQAAGLKKLAQDRQINSKNYLVKEAGIEHDRLILCAPEHRTEDDAVAGVEINI